MLDLVLGLVLCVVRLDGHAVVAHALFAVSAEGGVAFTVDLAILRCPVLVDLGHAYVRYLKWGVCVGQGRVGVRVRVDRVGLGGLLGRSGCLRGRVRVGVRLEGRG